VLATAPLKAGHAREELSRVGDPSWDLGPAVFRENARRCHVTVHFDVLEHADVQAAMRAYLYARLNVDLPGYREAAAREHPTGIQPRSPVLRLRARAAWAARPWPHRSGAGRCLCAHLRDDPARRPVIVGQLLQVVTDLYHLRDHLPGGGLVRALGRAAAARRRISACAREPHATHAGGDSHAAARLVAALCHDLRDRYSGGSGRARSARARRAGCSPPNADCPTQSAACGSARASSAISRAEPGKDAACPSGRPHTTAPRASIPTGEATPPINAHLLHLHAGIDAVAEPAMHLMLTTGAPAVIREAVASLGTEVGGMDTPISIDPESGRPWRARFDVKTLTIEERMLQAAAYIVCAYLTGMRDCEVQAMRRGCLSIARSEDGLIERQRVRSTLYKRRSSTGEAASWVTIEPVAEAITVLERLSERAARKTGSDTLWPVLRPAPSPRRICRARWSASSTPSATTSTPPSAAPMCRSSLPARMASRGASRRGSSGAPSRGTSPTVRSAPSPA
jgi:hypothetical protein